MLEKLKSLKKNMIKHSKKVDNCGKVLKYLRLVKVNVTL